MLELIKRIIFWITADRIGPDIPVNHWMLFFRSSMKRLCKKKFKRFSDTSDFRPNAYAVGCSKISIGDQVVIRAGTMLLADTNPGGGGITIENFVMIGSDVHVYADKHKIDDASKPVIQQGFYPSKGIVIKKGSWIGARAVICPDVTIGENSVVGASAVVINDVPGRVIVAGNPARIIKHI